MSAAFDFGGLAIDPAAYGSQGNAVLGIRDSGKTYTATGFAERLFAAGIPFVAFDPIGVWRFLRVPGAGAGIPIVVAGGKAGDLPLTRESAPKIVEAAMKSGVSLVIDLYDIGLSKADWKAIVCACLRLMLHENGQYGLRHIFLEEAAEFAPQRVGPDTAQVYAEVEKLSRMGGNARLGYTLINQRAEEVAKAVLENCENLFLHRQKGRHSIKALTDWLDVAGVDLPKAITDTLPMLPTGVCWAWMAGMTTPVRVQVPTKNSLHPDRRVMLGDIAEGQAAPTPIDASVFIGRVRAALESPTSGGAEKSPAPVEPLSQAARAAIRAEGFAEGKRASFSEGYEAGQKAGASFALAELRPVIGRLEGFAYGDDDGSVTPMIVTGTVDKGNGPVPVMLEIDPHSDAARAIADAGPGFSVSAEAVEDVGYVPMTISPAQQRILDKIAWCETFGVPASRIVVAALAGYTATGGGFRNYLGALRTAGLVSYPQPEMLALTSRGKPVAVRPGKPLTNQDVQAALLSMFDPAPQKILNTLIEAYPEAVSREELAKATGYEATGGGFRNYLGKLRSFGVATYPTDKMVQAAEILFPLAARRR